MEFLNPLREQLQSMWLSLVQVLPLLTIALLVVLVTGILSRVFVGILRRSLARSGLRPALQSLFATLLKVTIWLVGLLIATTVVFPSLTPAKMLTALGLGSVAIGFAFKDIFENFFAGVLIMLRKAMRIGDFIQCQDLMGKVEHIALRETYLRQTDGQLLIVPNRLLFQNPVHVITDRDLRRYEIIVGIAYSEDVETARGIILQAVEGLPLVNSAQPVEVYAREFGSSSIDFTVRWWGKSAPLDRHQSRDQVVQAIKAALDKAGVEIPFPYRTLTFKAPVPVQTENSDAAPQ